MSFYLLDGFPLRQVVINLRRGHSDNRRALLHCHALTFQDESNAASPVHGLFFRRRPATIPWLIISVIINSIERLTDGAFPHVIKEVLKHFSPALANRYPSTAVLGVNWEVWISASADHRSPSSISLRFPFGAGVVAMYPHISLSFRRERDARGIGRCGKTGF